VLIYGFSLGLLEYAKKKYPSVQLNCLEFVVSFCESNIKTSVQQMKFISVTGKDLQQHNRQKV